MSKIHCSITNCHYWDQGNSCNASEIMITSDSYASQAPDNIDALKHGPFPQMHADTCMETCCKTFADKNSDKFNLDGITRKNL